MTKIQGFQGEYRFLSNFWPCSITFVNQVYPSVEHAYQAAKTTSTLHRMQIQKAKDAAVAKKFGKEVMPRDGWDDDKYDYMLSFVRQKFAVEPLRKMLLDTGDAYLEETNWWGDTYWGVHNGVGENHLGHILMKVRAEIVGGLD